MSLSKRDAGIIAAHPEASPIELHQIYGMSKKGYDELVASGATATPSSTAVPGQKKVLTAQMPAAVVNQPVLKPVSQPASNTIAVRHVDGMNPVQLNPRIAQRMMAMQPDKFKKA